MCRNHSLFIAEQVGQFLQAGDESPLLHDGATLIKKNHVVDRSLHWPSWSIQRYGDLVAKRLDLLDGPLV